METGDDSLGIDRRRLVPVVQFGLWFFAFMLLESFVNSSVAALLGAQTVNAAYSIGIFCTATGLLAYGLMQAKRPDWCVKALPIVAAVCSAAALGVAFVQHAALLAAVSCLALLACGFVGGRVHIGVAREFGGGSICGRVIGAATGTVVCVQFLVQNLTRGPVPTLACIMTSLLALVILDSQGVRSTSLPVVNTDAQAQVRAWPEDPADKRHHGAYLVISAAILTVIFTLNDAVVVALDASGSLKLFSGVRLFYALGLVVAGCLYDLGPRFSFTFSTVAVQILAVLVPYFLWTPEWYNLNMALFYFYGGFYVMFITAEFVAFSGQMANSALWAGLGRMTRSYTAALSVTPVSLLYASLGVVSLVAAGVALNMALLAVCVADAMLLARYRLPELQPNESEAPVSAIVDFDEQDIERFAQSMGLTDRECAVLALMVTTEDENQKMADDLGISRRTLQRHIAQIYEKAGVQSRIGLYKSLTSFAASRQG